MIIADHLTSYAEESISIDGDTFAIVLRDKFTGWLGIKERRGCYRSCGSNRKINIFYTDDAPELKAAAKGLRWRHDTSTPGRPQNNGVAERAVRTVLEGARAILHASGLPSRWWSRAVRYYCFMHNVTKGRGGKPTPWDLICCETSPGEFHPFGCASTYKYALKDQNINDPRFGPSGKKGIPIGYHMNPGGGNGQNITKCWISIRSVTTLEANMFERDVVAKGRVKEGSRSFPVNKLRQKP